MDGVSNVGDDPRRAHSTAGGVGDKREHEIGGAWNEHRAPAGQGRALRPGPHIAGQSNGWAAQRPALLMASLCFPHS